MILTLKRLLLLVSCWLLAVAVRAQPTADWSTAQLRQALRQHPQADRYRVDLLNQLADEQTRTIEGIGYIMPWAQRDSLLTVSFTLARQLHYSQGEFYAQYLHPSFFSAEEEKITTKQQYRQWAEQKFLPWVEQGGNKAFLSRLLIATAFIDVHAPNSLRYLQRAVVLAQAAHVPRLLCHAYRAQGYYYREMGDYYQGLQGLFRQLRAARQAGLPDEVMEALGSIGNLYTHMGDDQQAIQYYQQALPYAASVTPASYRTLLQQQALSALGYGYQRAGNYAQALAALHRATRLEVVGNKYAIDSKVYIAEILEKQHDARALTYTRQLLRQARSQRQDRYYPEILMTLGRYYLRVGQADSAVSNGQKALGLIREFGDREDQTNVVELLAQAYALQRQFAKAYIYQRRYQGLHDTLRNEQMTRRVTALRFSQDMARQRSQIAQLTQSQQRQVRAARRQRLWLLAALGGLALLGGGAGLLWRLYRQKQRANILMASQKAQLEEQAARLGELDEAKNQFFANVSHELRTPLTLVLGPLDTLLTSPAQLLSAAARPSATLAYRQAQRLEQLVNRILDLTKLQAGQLALRPQPTSLVALLRRVVTQFESLAAQRNLALIGPPALPDELSLLLDTDKIEEILTNLLINALNHTPAGGSVRVTAALPAPDGLYHVTVHDTGPGIAPTEQARVFERFYQSPQRHAQGGTGLGLALSRELAQLLGGSLTLVSEPGQGAAFTLRFPAPLLPAPPRVRADAPAPALEAPPASPLPFSDATRRPRVLVVEDQADLREYLRSLLAPSYDVLVAEDGQAALELLAREAPVDLITTDAMMPRLSGIELLTQLRADPVQAGVPVLMLTARADEAYRLSALTVGVDDYLTKPFATRELLARVRALLAHQQVRRHFATLPPEAEELAPDYPAGPLAPASPLATADLVVITAPPASRRKAAPLLAAEQLGQWQAQVAGQLANEQFGPAELAALLCLSERTLYRRLGELAGLTPAAWLRELRLNQARHLLEAGSFGSVAEVADAVGFANPKYFANLYAERFGRRPAEYTP